jgi:DNA-binding NarL/FixJ family response regulator
VRRPGRGRPGAGLQPDGAVSPNGAVPPNGAVRSASPALRNGRPPDSLASNSAALIPLSVLTAREVEIALLIARGLSNRGIADELFISPATAARHVANILAKLGFSSRAQVAAWVADHRVAGHLQQG